MKTEMYRIVFSNDAKKDLKELSKKAPQASHHCDVGPFLFTLIIWLTFIRIINSFFAVNSSLKIGYTIDIMLTCVFLILTYEQLIIF